MGVSVNMSVRSSASQRSASAGLRARPTSAAAGGARNATLHSVLCALCTALYCTLLCCTASHYTALHRTALLSIILHSISCTPLYCAVLRCAALGEIGLYCVG